MNVTLPPVLAMNNGTGGKSCPAESSNIYGPPRDTGLVFTTYWINSCVYILCQIYMNPNWRQDVTKGVVQSLDTGMFGMNIRNVTAHILNRCGSKTDL